MGVSTTIIVLRYHESSSKLQIDKTVNKVLLSDNYQVNQTARC